MVEKSCPVLVVMDDDDYRRRLIKTLDEQHFSVSFASEQPDAKKLLAERSFAVALVGLNLMTRRGVDVLDHLQSHRDRVNAVIILGDPNPEVRTYAPWADETLLKPVDPAYVATRARTYCGH